MTWTAERYHDISCGHRVHNQGSKCEEPHGHNYRVHFKCVADSGLDSVGRVIDFSDMKSALCMWLEDNWDHKFLAWKDDPIMREAFEATKHLPHFNRGIIWVPFNPTAENMAQYLVEVIGPMRLVGTGIRLESCRVDETRKCSATYTRKG